MLVFPPSGHAVMPSCFPHLRDGAGLWVQFIDTEKVKKTRSLYLTWFLLQALQWLAALPSEQIPSSAWKPVFEPVSLRVTVIPSLRCVPHCSRSECLVCMGSCSHPPGLASLSWSVLLHLLSPDLLFVSPTHP